VDDVVWLISEVAGAGTLLEMMLVAPTPRRSFVTMIAVAAVAVVAVAAAAVVVLLAVVVEDVVVLDSNSM
jgi:hypothetical protein